MRRPRRSLFLFCFSLAAVFGGGAVASPGAERQLAESTEAWRSAVQAGNATVLAALYSTSPAAQIKDKSGKDISLQEELSFWTDWKTKGLTSVKMEIVQEQTPQPTVHSITTRLTLGTKTNGTTKRYYLLLAQTWLQQGDGWHIAMEQHTDSSGLPQPIENKDLYPAGADAKAEIAEAVKKAAATHKRVLLVFGGNWCYDCHVLDEAFHSPEIAPTLNRGFEVVHVDIGEMNKNLDIARQYDTPIEGVPVMAVLDSDGKVLFSQKHHEFSATRSLSAADILAFLNQWKPANHKQ